MSEFDSESIAGDETDFRPMFPSGEHLKHIEKHRLCQFGTNRLVEQ
jgi:hypothetical protein